MATSLTSQGLTITYTNSSGSTITSGTVVEFATGKIGVALADIANGATGPLAVSGIWDIPKTAGVTPTQGQTVYLVTGATTITTVTTGNTLLNGYPAEAGTTAMSTIEIRLF